MKKVYQQETLAVLVNDQALRECRAVRGEGGLEPSGASWRRVATDPCAGSL